MKVLYSGILAPCLVATCLLAEPVLAASDAVSTQRIALNIPAQPLSDALNSLAHQSNVQVVFYSNLGQGLTAQRLEGSFTIREALDQLLAKTDLTYEFVDGGVVRILPKQTTGNAGRGSTSTSSGVDDTVEEVLVFGTLENRLSAGSKSGLSLRETPKSVTLVTRERIEAQNLTSLNDALNQTTGVTLSSFTSVSTFFFSRGFRVQTLQFDGGAPAYDGGYGMFLTPDTAVYDHIEMLRGVDGMYSGAGEPGGVINLVRKRAKSTPQIKTSLSAGSWNRYRGELDLTGPITEDGRLRGRVVAAYEDKNYFYDRGESNKSVFFGTGEYDITPSTLLIVGASYERRKEDGYFTWGFPRYTDGRSLGLPTSTAFNPEWAHWYFTNQEVFVRAEQKYGDSGVIKLNATRFAQKSELRQFTNYGAVNPLTGTGTVSYGGGTDYDSVQNLLDLSFNGTVSLFGLEHRYTFGADYSKVDGGGQKDYALTGYAYPGPAVNVFNFDPNAYPEPTAVLSGLYPENGQTQNGFYATVGLQLAEPLRLTFGGRYGEYRFKQIYRPVASNGTVGAPRTLSYEDSKFIPSAALSLNFAEDWSAYLSFGETFKSQGNFLRASGGSLSPVTGDSLELGIKGEIAGVLNASVAVYRMTRNGQGVRDPAFPPTPGNNGSSCCYVQQADVTSDGFDAELSGTVTPGWQLFAGYTFNSNRFDGDSRALYSAGAYFLNMTPKHMLKMWTTWQLPGQLSRWTVNGGVLAQSESYVTGTALATAGGNTYVPYRFAQSAYAILNASVQFEINERWSVGVYGDNLSNKTYYQTLGLPSSENVYGTPRSYMLTLRGNW
ncbi:TonB-dependent siderophore receptor [Steroidobacter sp.]|uniref:TonB-dependent siderophore receptor n=1 Tax=Steroidobacter sp. TaxID=1978227 RepID=UPI001A6084ED|nr:TonB-dependent receptor [Steroidobacter sp.]MBL8270911.1 TonB-dependent siderophore receptor [Steroidobacter sp.]